MYFDISEQRLPVIYKRGNKDCYLDPVRKKLIYITPEETVRQKVISYLVDDLNVPAEMISVEAHLSHYGIQSKRRADIIVHGADSEGVLRPVAIVECKAPGIILGEKVAEQITDYCNLLGCDFAMMVNDCESFCYHYDEKRDAYIQIDGLPEYRELLENKFSVFDPGEFPNRIPYNEISQFLEENLDEHDSNISNLTEHNLACAAFNLLEGLLDPRHKLPIRKYDMFSLVEDYGVRILSYGDASGGIHSGLYRSFIIDINGSTEFVSIGLSTYATYAHLDNVKTVLNVAIDNEKESHHSLQLVLDDNVENIGNKFIFFHHGRIAVGNKGSGKIDELREYVVARRPQLIYGKKFCLGSLINDREWHIDDPEVVKLIENLISYALIRDEYRNEVKQRK
jgi:hypothetical protein